MTEWAAAPDPDMLLLVSCEKWDAGSRKSKWAANLAKAGIRWISGLSVRRSCQAGLSSVCSNTVCSRNLKSCVYWRTGWKATCLAARQEIDRLALLKGAGAITAEDVLDAVANSSRFDAFALAEHMLTGNLRESLRVSNGLKRMDTPIHHVFWEPCCGVENHRGIPACDARGARAVVFRRLNVWKNRQHSIRMAARRLDPLAASMMRSGYCR